MSEVGNIALIEACKAQTNTPMVRVFLSHTRKSWLTSS